MNRARSPRQRRVGGQALVEFALVCPLLVLILGMMIDLGLGYYTSGDLEKAAKDAASSGAAKNLDDPSVMSLVSATLRTYKLDPTRATITVSHPIIEGFNTVRVDITFAFVPLSPGVQAVTGPTLNLSAGAVYAKGS